jgi:preprotein translocase subunit SecA
VRAMQPGLHFNTDAAGRNVFFTDQGLDDLEAQLACGSLHDLKNLELFTGLNLAMHAQVLLARDKDYIVRNGKVELVDEFTGRIAENRQWPYGLQAAIEAKEGLEIKPEGMIRNAITLVHFMKLYPRLAAMTATAQAASKELYEFYDLTTVVIPPNCPCQREDLPDTLFASKAAKESALVAEIVQVQRTGRPTLVGTSSVSESERLAERLGDAGVACRVLNAKNDEQEAGIIAKAGKLGAVTISTNMAGRGTDIQLGCGDPGERKRVCALGGLYVIGTNRHESRRIDDQLRGRAGRQGDPGSSCFYVSLQDDLMQQYGLVGSLPRQIQQQGTDEPLNNRAVHGEIERAQRIIEDQNFQIRQTLTRYSKMVEDQRKIVSARRQQVLTNRESLCFFEAQLPDLYQRLCAGAGRDRIFQIEQRVTLFHMDNHWAQYMCEVDVLRKFIHIRSLDGCNPLDLFHRTIIQSFRAMRDDVEAAILETLKHMELSDQGELLGDCLPRTPAATWTYVINDNPLGDWTQRLRSQVRNMVKGNHDWD